MTKIEAIQKLMEDNGGAASWVFIYNNIEKYYPSAKSSRNWRAGLRGVLYREIGKGFKKIGLGIYALSDYKEEPKEKIISNPIRMHSYMQGICIELGNIDGFHTFSADPTAPFKDNISLGELTAMKAIPNFTYSEIVKAASKIDVLWFNTTGFQFPKRAIEIVDSIGTLGEAFTRTYQLLDFDTEFYIIGKEKDKANFDKRRQLAPYNRIARRFVYRSYDEIISVYESKLRIKEIGF